MTITISETRNIEACLLLRRKVFIEEQAVTEAEEIDGLDDQAIHLLACDDNVHVGTARIIVTGSAGKIGRVCVLPNCRGTGLGAALIRHSLGLLRQNSLIKVAQLGAQSHALDFYKRLGFKIAGPEYQDAGIAHFDMEQTL